MDTVSGIVGDRCAVQMEVGALFQGDAGPLIAADGSAVQLQRRVCGKMTNFQRAHLREPWLLGTQEVYTTAAVFTLVGIENLKTPFRGLAWRILQAEAGARKLR